MKSVAGLSDLGSGARAQVRVDGLELRVGHVPSAIIGYFRALQDADAPSLSLLLTPEFTVSDERRDPPRAVDSAAALLDAMSGLAGVDFEVRLLAVGGDLLALVRFILRDAGETVSDALAVAQCTEAGQVASVQIFDIAEVLDAVDSFNALHLLAYPSRQGKVLELAGRLWSAMAERNIDGVTELLDAEMRQIDYRDGGALQLSRDESVSAFRAVLDDDVDLIDLVTEVHDVTPRGMVASITQATRESLGLTDTEVTLVAVTGDHVDLVEFYDASGRDRALERLCELSARVAE